MATQPRTISAPSRQIWLRRSDPANPDPPGMWRDMALSVIGNAAARETFVTATPHMAAICTDLFQSMIRWILNCSGAVTGLALGAMRGLLIRAYSGVIWPEHI